MFHFVGLDVSVKETAEWVVDDAGKVMLEQKVPSEPDDIVTLLTSVGVDYRRVGIEAGPLSQWLVNGMAKAGCRLRLLQRQLQQLGLRCAPGMAHPTRGTIVPVQRALARRHLLPGEQRFSRLHPLPGRRDCERLSSRRGLLRYDVLPRGCAPAAIAAIASARRPGLSCPKRLIGSRPTGAVFRRRVNVGCATSSPIEARRYCSTHRSRRTEPMLSLRVAYVWRCGNCTDS